MQDLFDTDADIGPDDKSKLKVKKDSSKTASNAGLANYASEEDMIVAIDHVEPLIFSGGNVSGNTCFPLLDGDKCGFFPIYCIVE